MEDKLKHQKDLPDTFVPDDDIQSILVYAGVPCRLDKPHTGKPGLEAACPLDIADLKLQALITKRIKEELEAMVTRFKNGLKGQSPEFKYVMRPIIKSIEDRLKEINNAGN